MHPKISVIVPVYRAERFLRRCIDSILSQTLADFELLLVDDGSPDRSGAICDEYADRDKRIRVIHKPNTGVSDARNRALDLASGEYVIFMDADDYWMTDTALEQLHEAAGPRRLDIVRGEYTAVDEAGQEIFSRPVSPRRMQYANQVAGSYEFLEYAVHGEFFLPLALIRRDLIGEIRFESGRIFLEDMQFLSRLMVRPLRCMYRPDIRFYAYRKNTQSVSNRINPQKLRDSFGMSDFFHDLSHLANDPLVKKYFQSMSLCIYCSTLETLAVDDYYPERASLMIDLQVHDRWKRLQSWVKEYKLRNPIMSCRLSPDLSLHLMRLKYKLIQYRGSVGRKLRNLRHC